MRYFYPQLRLKKYETDVCNCCFRIDTELGDKTTSKERKAALKLEKATHLGKIQKSFRKVLSLQKM